MEFPKKVLIDVLRDGTPIYETVENEEELDLLEWEMDEEREYVRNYFAQYGI